MKTTSWNLREAGRDPCIIGRGNRVGKKEQRDGENARLLKRVAPGSWLRPSIISHGDYRFERSIDVAGFMGPRFKKNWPSRQEGKLKRVRGIEGGEGGEGENPSSIERVVTSSLWILIDIREFGYLGGDQSRHFEVEEIRRIIEEKFSFCIVLISFILCFCIYFKETGDAENFS